MTVALVLGGAASMWKDADAACQFVAFDVIVACNMAFVEWPGRVDHACSFHAELLPHFAEQRRRAGRPEAGGYWTARGHRAPPGLPMRFVENWGGSSGLLAAQVALEIADKAVLCGIPLDPDAEHFDRRGPWPDAMIHRRAWEAHRGDLVGRVRSMSGWSAALLGEPTKEWLHDRYSEDRPARNEG